MYKKIIRPLLFKLPAETAHRLAIFALKANLIPAPKEITSTRLQTQLLGLDFPTPIGLAAGFDKNGECYSGLLKQGFGFVEVGTVTPRPQIGNPKPRLFRLAEDQAIINRMGFNNNGADLMRGKLEGRDKSAGIVGVNIGKNKDTLDAASDYLTLLDAFYPLADYLVVNISSPNTTGLRDLQGEAALFELMQALIARKNELAQQYGRTIALLVKIAPDLDTAQMEAIAEVALKLSFDGIIVSNTTISRPNLLSAEKEQTGGLSGAPLFDLSTQTLAQIYRLTQGKIPLIGVGGVSNLNQLLAKIRAGASLVQIYSALIYEGIDLSARLNKELDNWLAQQNIPNISQLIGSNVSK